MRTKQVNQVIRHPRITFGAVIMNVNKRSVSADARGFTPNYLLGVDLFNEADLYLFFDSSPPVSHD